MQQQTDINRQEKGFSLVELIIYFTIFSLLIVLVSQFLFEAKSLRLEAEGFQSLNRDTRFVFLEIQNAVRSAQAIDFPGPGESGNYLSLNGGQIIYSLNAEKVLEKQTLTESLPLHSSKIFFENLIFERSANLDQEENVKMEMTVKSQTLFEGEREKSLTLQTTVSLR